MPASDATRARLITGSVAVATAVGVAAVVTTDDGDLSLLAHMACWVAIAVLVTGLVGAWPTTAPVAAVLLGAGFTATLAGEPHAVDLRVVPVAIGLLVVAEVGAWSAEARTAGLPGTRPRRRAARLAAVTLSATAVTLAIAALANLPIKADLANAALGVGSVALVAGLLAALVRYSPSGRPT